MKKYLLFIGIGCMLALARHTFSDDTPPNEAGASGAQETIVRPDKVDVEDSSKAAPPDSIDIAKNASDEQALKKPLSAEEQQEVKEIVEKLTDPQKPNILVAVQQQVLNYIMEKQKKEEQATLANFFEKNPNGIQGVKGPKIGTGQGTTLVHAFIAPFCIHCKDVMNDFKKLVEKNPIYDISLLLLSEDTGPSNLVARALMAASEMGKFNEYFEAMQKPLQENMSAIDKEKLLKFAEELRLDKEKFSELMESEKIGNELKKITELAKEFRIQGTPSMVVHDPKAKKHKLLSGKPNAEKLDALLSNFDDEKKEGPKIDQAAATSE